MRAKKVDFSIVAVGLVGCVAAFEITLRFVETFPADPEVKAPKEEIAKYIGCECPYLYANNPAREGISAQGLRDREFEIPKPERTIRILVLGDSVPYANDLSPEHSFPKLLEQRLNKDLENVEVVNGSAEGYSPYNEWMYYRYAGREFQPDFVITQLSLNDIVNPRLHWSWMLESGLLDAIPAGAIPNAAYDSEIQARTTKTEEATAQGEPPLQLFSRSWRTLREFVHRRRPITNQPVTNQPADTEEFPLHLTGEDSIPITVWLDYESPEWSWLRSILDKLSADTAADGAEHLLLMVPLGYQLESTYPHRPQTLFARYCAESGLRCVDPLSTMQRDDGANLFMGGEDIWHLSERGQEVVAEQLAAALMPLIERKQSTNE